VCSCSEGTARSAGQAATRRTDAMGAAEQSGAWDLLLVLDSRQEDKQIHTCAGWAGCLQQNKTCLQSREFRMGCKDPGVRARR
jgi:hypothetical protein